MLWAPVPHSGPLAPLSGPSRAWALCWSMEHGRWAPRCTRSVAPRLAVGGTCSLQREERGGVLRYVGRHTKGHQGPAIDEIEICCNL